MTTTYARKGSKPAPRKAFKSSKPRRDATQSKVPTKVDAKGNIDIDFAEVLLLALTVPGQLSNAYSRFHRYSFLNMVLAYSQTGKLEPMANFKKWQALGRKVISGPGSALFVNHPLYIVYKRDDAGNLLLDKDGRRIPAYTRYGLKPTVFQLFQTDGPELEFPPTPEWNKDAALKVLDIKQVPFDSGDGNVQGYSVERKFALNPVAVAPFKTMIHEWAHVLLGHTTKSELAEYKSHRGIKEFQAEAVALLVCRELGIEGFDESASRAYIQHWLAGTAHDYVKDGELVEDSTVRAIFNVADKILVAGRKRHWDKLAEKEHAA